MPTYMIYNESLVNHFEMTKFKPSKDEELYYLDAQIVTPYPTPNKIHSRSSLYFIWHREKNDLKCKLYSNRTFIWCLYGVKMYVYTDVKLCVRKTFLKNKILGIKIWVMLRALLKNKKKKIILKNAFFRLLNHWLHTFS